MLTDNQLAVEVRRLAKNRRHVILLLLAHVVRPAQTGAIIDKGLSVGFRSIKEWNVSMVLKMAERQSEVTRFPAGWELLEPGMATLIAAGVKLDSKPAPVPSDTILPRELFEKTRGYIERVGVQINGSYDHGYYDCCAVMCRRMAETLIIEVREPGPCRRTEGQRRSVPYAERPVDRVPQRQEVQSWAQH